MNKKLIIRVVILVVFIYLFAIGVNRIYKDRSIDYISSSLVLYDLFLPYILGIVLSIIGKFYFSMNKNKLMFMAIVNAVVFTIEIIVMAIVKLAMTPEVYVLISLCLAFVINSFLLELDFGHNKS